MALEDITPREGFFMLIGMGITILLIKSFVLFWRHEYRSGALFLILGAVLVFIFFRRRLIVLAIMAPTFILVNFGLPLIFHPTLLGTVLTAGSAASIFLLVRWHARKYPNLKAKDRMKILENRK
jgi:hypothetical protein